MMILITGGSASGKSEIAETMASQMGCQPMCYLATMHAEDEESKQRIGRHREMRKEKEFATLERSTGLLGILQESAKYETILLECLTNLVANELFINQKEDMLVVNDILAAIDALAEKIPLLVIVTGDVFGDGGKYMAPTSRYLWVLGKLNQAIANRASIVVEAIYGLMVVHKGKEILADESFC